MFDILHIIILQEIVFFLMTNQTKNLLLDKLFVSFILFDLI